jgi:co-chaperonin GroES (HSP10)
MVVLSATSGWRWRESTDVATKRLVGSCWTANEYGKHKDIKIGSVIIFDAYVGMAMANEVTDSEKYRIMFLKRYLGIHYTEIIII